MTILLSSAELEHFAKVGGLADISSALPIGWDKLGHDPIIVLPKYGCISDSDGTSIIDMHIELTICSHSIHVYKSHIQKTEIPVYLVECAALYDRPGIYGNPDGYTDNDLRFYVLCKAAFEIMIKLNISPDIISAHDYHTALLLPMLKLDYADHPLFAKTKGILTIHNAQYQGWYDNERMQVISGWELLDNSSNSQFLLNNSFNALYAGITFADAIVAVSPGYAKEILTVEFGEGLEAIFQKFQGKLHGILNGVNYDVWNPNMDEYITNHFTINDLEGKVKGRHQLITQLFSSSHDKESLPLFGIVSRFTSQKGFDLLKGCIEHYLQEESIRLIVLGSGDRSYEEYFTALHQRFPKSCSYTQGYNESLAHAILAYADFFLMPSAFEPCGLTQIYAMKYGTIPIVRHVGGLKDTVQTFEIDSAVGNGLVFTDFSAKALSKSIENAISCYEDQQLMSALIKNAMKSNYSIGHTAEQYIALFNNLRDPH